MMFTSTKAIIGVLILVCLLQSQNLIAQTQWSNPATVGSRPEVVLLYSYQWVTEGKGHQDLKIVCKNITTDKIKFKIKYEVHFHSGDVERVASSNSIELKPGEVYDPQSLADWGGVYMRYFLTPTGGKYGAKEKWFQFGKDSYGTPLYTAIHSVMNMKITDFENLSLKEREEKERLEEEKLEKQKKEAEAKKRKEEEEQKRLSDEKAKQEVEKQRLEEENRRKQSASNQVQNSGGKTATDTSSKTEEARKDFVPGTLSVDQYRSYPEEFKTNDGKYVKKDNGHLVYISEKEYNDRKNEQRINLERQGEQARAKLQEEQNRKAQATIDNIRKQEQESIARRERSDAYMQQASYYGVQASNAKEMRIEASRFQQTHTDLASLEAEYNAKIRQLSAAAETEQLATSAAYASAASSIAEAGWGNSAISQSAGELGSALGGLIASNRADKARKELAEERKRQAEAIAKAKKEHEEAERKLRAEAERLRKEGIINLRQQLAKTFIDGGTPLQKHNITQLEVYLFAYSSLKSDWFTANNANLMVSNIIPIYKMSDDTYPYKNTVLKTLSPLGDVNDITLIGFFTDKAEIEKIRANFISSAQKAEFTVRTVDIKVKENPALSSSNADDFWETEQTPATTKQETSPIGFWD